MIEIYADRQKGRCRLLVTGHAEGSPDRELVCAGISAMVDALAALAREHADCGHVRCWMRPGEFFLSCRGGLGRAFDLAMTAFRRMAGQYPQDAVIRRAEGC